MKKLLYLSFAALVAVSMLQSCNKKLKKELAELDNSVTELQNKNTDLENQLLNANNTIANLDSIFEANKPMTWSVTCTDNSVTPTVSFAKSYTAKYLLEAKSDYQYLSDMGSNEWYLYVYKSEDFNWDNTANVRLYINSTTQTFSAVYLNSRISAFHYEPYNGGTNFGISSTKNQLDVTMTLNSGSFNTTTGDVSFNISYTDASGYTFGGAESGSISWSGNCFIYKN